MIDHFLYLAIVVFVGSLGFAGVSGGHEDRCLRMAKRLYFCATSMVLIVLIGKLYAQRSFWIASFEQGFLLSIILLGLICFLGDRRFKLSVTPALAAAVALFLGILATLFPGEKESLETASWLLGGHTFLIFLSLSAYSVSFIFSVLFLVENHLLKKRLFGPLLYRLPPLELSSELNSLFIFVGTVAFAAGTIKGMIYLHTISPETRLIEVSTIFLSGIVVAFYLMILFFRKGILEGKAGTAYASIAAYILYWIVVCLAHASVGGIP